MSNQALGTVKITKLEELSVTAKGKQFLKFTGLSYHWSQTNNQLVPSYHKFTLWGRRAESIGKCLSEGSNVFIKGMIRYNKSEKDGKFYTNINVEEIDFEGEVPDECLQFKAIIRGRLTKDPIQGSTKNGKPFTGITVVTQKHQDKTMFHDCSAWGELAMPAAKYLEKGQRVYLEAVINYRKTDDGKYFTKLNIQTFSCLGKSQSKEKQAVA